MKVSEIDKLVIQASKKINQYQEILESIKQNDYRVLMNDFYTKDTYSFIVNIVKNSEELIGNKMSIHDLQKYIADLVNEFFQKHFKNITVELTRPNSFPSPLSIKHKDTGDEIIRIDMRKKTFAKHYKPFSENEIRKNIDHIREDIDYYKDKINKDKEILDSFTNHRIKLFFDSLMSEGWSYLISNVKYYIYSLRNEDKIIDNINKRIENYENKIKENEKRVKEVLKFSSDWRHNDIKNLIMYTDLKRFMNVLGYTELEDKIY